jgi:hypothetical protein
MRLVNDRRLLMQLATPEIAEARALAKWIKVAICVVLATALICAEFSSSIELMQSNPDLELTP